MSPLDMGTFELVVNRQYLALPPYSPLVLSAAVDGASVWSSFLEWKVVPWRPSGVRQLNPSSCLWLSATVMEEPGRTASPGAFEKAFDACTIFIGDSTINTDDWSQGPNSIYMNSGRLDSNDQTFATDPARNSLDLGADWSCLFNHYNDLDEVSAVMAVFGYVNQLSDHLDTQCFRFVIRLPTHAFKIWHGNEVWLATVSALAHAWAPQDRTLIDGLVLHVLAYR